jgi:hypothetical protein
MAAIWHRINTLLLLLVLLTLLAIVAMLASGVRGGSLDPEDPPASTMKSLDDIPGSWNRVLPADDGSAGPNPPAGCDSSRFECLEDFFNNAVLDRETGLVWDLDTTCCDPGTWPDANASVCFTNRYNTAQGWRLGWRLPTIEELHSVVQHFVGPPLLPPGNPFIVLTDDAYWTATSSSSTTAYAVHLGTGVVSNEPKTNTNYAWCVRGGYGHDGM